MSIQFDQEFFNNIKEKAEKKLANNDTSRFSVISNAESLSHSFLLSKLTFNLSKGHYYFVYEILKTKIEKLQIMGIEADPNEQASLNQPWLQAEKDQMSRKFRQLKIIFFWFGRNPNRIQEIGTSHVMG